MMTMSILPVNPATEETPPLVVSDSQPLDCQRHSAADLIRQENGGTEIQ
jgi:hypothetical protein